jgi:hypothetical protein
MPELFSDPFGSIKRNVVHRLRRRTLLFAIVQNSIMGEVPQGYMQKGNSRTQKDHQNYLYDKLSSPLPSALSFSVQNLISSHVAKSSSGVATLLTVRCMGIILSSDYWPAIKSNPGILPLSPFPSPRSSD